MSQAYSNCDFLNGSASFLGLRNKHRDETKIWHQNPYAGYFEHRFFGFQLS